MVINSFIQACKTSFFCLFLLVYSNGFAQTIIEPTTTFSPEQLRADFQVLRTQLETVNVGLYRYTPKAKMDAVFDSLHAKINRPMTELEFWRMLLPLSDYIQNGHTIFYFSEATNNWANTEGLWLPLDTYFTGDSWRIVRDLSDEKGMKVGDKIIEINSKSVADIWNTFRQYLPRDGANETLAARSSHRLSRYFTLFFGFQKEYTITFINQKNEHKSLIVKGLTRSKIEKNRAQLVQQATTKKSAPPIHLELLDEKTALLTVESFDTKSLRKNGAPFRKSYKKAFQTIQENNIEHLILDLRNNGGGDDNATRLLTRYLYDKPFFYYENVFISTRKIDKKTGYKGMVWHYNQYLKLKSKRKKIDGKYAFKIPEKRRAYQPKKEVFTSDLYVLMNGHSYSASGEIISFLKHHNRGIFIGAEAGGNRQANTSGIALQLLLPNTNLQIYVPVIQYVMAKVEMPTNRGVFPDYPISSSFDDYITERNVELEKALELIKKSNEHESSRIFEK